jgi:hypothetical protein
MSTQVVPENSGSAKTEDAKEIRIKSAKNKWATGAKKIIRTAKLSVLVHKNSGIDLLVQEHAEHGHGHDASPYMIHPNNPIRRAWDVVTILFVLYLCWKIPFSLGFEFWTGNKDLKVSFHEKPFP